MDRRLFLASTFATAVDLITPKQGEKQLVIDYSSKDPNLYRTVAYDGDEVAHMPPAGVSKDTLPNFTYYDVKQAWVLPDGRLEMERYSVSWISHGGKHEIVTHRDLDGEIKTFTTVLDKWKLVTVDQMGRSIRERRSERT